MRSVGSVNGHPAAVIPGWGSGSRRIRGSVGRVAMLRAWLHGLHAARRFASLWSLGSSNWSTSVEWNVQKSSRIWQTPRSRARTHWRIVCQLTGFPVRVRRTLPTSHDRYVPLLVSFDSDLSVSTGPRLDAGHVSRPTAGGLVA